jgi:hypothetical protein
MGFIVDTAINLITSPIRAVGHQASATFNVAATLLSASPPGLLFSAVTHNGDALANVKQHGSEAINHTAKAASAATQAVALASIPLTGGASAVPAFAIAAAETAATKDGWTGKGLLHNQPKK